MKEVTACAIDETLEIVEEAKKTLGFRSAMLSGYAWGKWSFGLRVKEIFNSAFITLCYGSQHGMQGRGKKVTEVDVNDLIEKWMTVVRGLALAHDKDQEDYYEAQVNGLLTPLLTAPKRQVLDFCKKLLVRMKEDQSVPYIIWRTFEVWATAFVINGSEEGIKRLKRKLATEIVDMVEDDVKADFREAMIKALMWRDGDTLEKVKEAVVEAQESGVRPRLKGRESCLFLEIQKGRTKKVCVQV